MPEPTHDGRPIKLTTPLGKDKMLITGFQAVETVSQLFHYTVDAIAKPAAGVAFDKLLGQSVTVSLINVNSGNKPIRHCNGFVRSITQGEFDGNYTQWRLELVPKVWTLTKVWQSRIFQQKSVPDILKVVLAGFDVAYEIQGTFEPRDYCVQYRETDWHFATRLMEEEGIFYFFKHTDGGHQMVVTTPGTTPDVPAPANVTYKNIHSSLSKDEDVIFEWGKTQEMIAGKFALWDHCFEAPSQNYESKANIPDSVTVGEVSHKLKVGNDSLEVYDYPGEFAQRFDGVNPGGADAASMLSKIAPDGTRTVKIRAEAEAATAVTIRGLSTCRQFVAGHKFTVARQTDDPLSKELKPNGAYMLTSVTHTAVVQDGYSSSSNEGFSYQNSFTVIPAAAVYRPPITAVKPTVMGTQTGTVVGPSGEEIFTDKYGRVKVQFHWDRQGKRDGSSSCWIRVATPWAGRQWGMFHLPRIGQEVVIDYIEGDPDQPIIVGSVYNSAQMPAYELPANKTKSWVKTNSSLGGEGYNEIRFEDKKGSEQIYIHGEKNLDIRIRNESMFISNNHKHVIIGGNDVTAGEDKKADYRELVWQDKHTNIKRHQEDWVEGSVKLTVGHGEGEDPGNWDITLEADRHATIGGEDHLHVAKNSKTTIDGDQDLHVKGLSTSTYDSEQDIHVKADRWVDVDGDLYETCTNFTLKSKSNEAHDVGADLGIKVGGAAAFDAAGDFTVKAAKIVLEATSQISLKVGGNFINISSSGVDIQGTMTKINSGGAAGSAAAVTPANLDGPVDAVDATDAKKAKPTAPTVADKSATGFKSRD